MVKEEIRIKELEKEIEMLKYKRLELSHKFKIEELNIRLEIATLMKSKGKKLRQKIKKVKEKMENEKNGK